MTCNFGTQIEGTALSLQIPVQVDGTSGANVTFDAEVAGVSAPQLTHGIQNSFLMDMDWSAPSNIIKRSGNVRTSQFEWTLYWGRNSDQGPANVSYTVTLNPSTGTLQQAYDCSAFDDARASGHPNSGAGSPAEQTAPFAACSLVRIGGSNQYTMTLSGLDYTLATVPTKDSGGNLLPVDRVAIASGKIQVDVLAADNGDVTLTSTAPTYTSVSGSVSTDNPANNTANKTWLNYGTWVSNWERPFTNSGGTSFDDTYRVSAGMTVRSTQYFDEQMTKSGKAPSTLVGLCTILDSKYAQYESYETVMHPSLTPIPGVMMQWFVGGYAAVYPPAPGYNPGSANCSDLPTGAWVSTEPADKSTVRAVQALMPLSAISTDSRAILYVNQTIKDDAPVGMDVWQFSQYYEAGVGWLPVQPNNSVITAISGARYSSTNASRDVLRIVGLTPSVSKAVDKTTLRPGEPATYTLEYSANGGSAAAVTVDGYKIVDKLPVGLAYVAGSAFPEPVITMAAGAQTLTWTLDGVPTNTVNSLVYQAQTTSDAQPGQRLVNSVTTTVGGRESAAARATVTVSTSGATILGKSSDQDLIPNIAGDGVGQGSWTVSLRSEDPTTQTYTDVIDILPYNGDQRGTTFSGNYALTDVVVNDGETVYYTMTAPAGLSDDPADASNGAANTTTGNTVGWTTAKPADASAITAVRVIGGALPSGALRSFKVVIETAGATGGDTFVNRVQARASHTELVMRISAPTTVSQQYAYDLKKYVKDVEGNWHDAQDTNDADWPVLPYGEAAQYKIVVTNTGRGDLTDIKVSDALFPDADFTIDSLLSGESHEKEFQEDLTSQTTAHVTNVASATTTLPEDSNQEDLPDPSDEANVDIANYEVKKTSTPASPATVAVGETINYTVSVKQLGSAPADAMFVDTLENVLDDATFNDDAQASIGTVSYAEPVIAWSGIVGVGATATITYSVTVKAGGDNLIDNVVASQGCTVVDGETPDCKTNHTVGGYSVSKTADPASGGAVKSGEKITYKVQVKHTGEGAVTGAAISDDLSKVLDDATYNGDAVASAGSAKVEGTNLLWTGDLAKGAVVDITYSVTVKTGGDQSLVNTVKPGKPGEPEDPRGVCVPAPDQNADCSTTHLIGGYSVSKTADPATGSSVKVGDKITYKVQVKQSGENAVKGAVATDDLSKVLDDATYNNDAVASNGGTVAYDVAAQKLLWTGDLAKGAVVDITYSVTVKAGGDKALTNTVTPGLDGTCVPAADENADCTTTHLIGGYSVSKTADPATGSSVAAGDKITYKVQVKQAGEGAVAGAAVSDDLSKVLDDATYNGDVVASAGSATVEGSNLLWTGDLAKGAVVDITYSVTVKTGGDKSLVNTVNPGKPGEPNDPRGVCVPAADQNADCTTTHLIGGYSVSKTADPATGSSVKVGDKVTYKVQVKQTGEGAVAGAAVSDDLSKVLDDATYNGDVVASAGSATVEGSNLLWTGDLAKGAVVDITYSVTVKTGGDKSLVNTVKPGNPGEPEDPRGVCVPAADQNADCTTTHLIGGYSVSKTADPATGSSVKVGDKVTYKVQVKQTGEGAVAGASISDDLSKVLDDATYNGDVAASAGSATVEGSNLLWTGDLAKGDVVDVTYSVTVKAGGDKSLVNTVKPGNPGEPEDPRGVCVPAADQNADCTTVHVMGSYTVSKTADPASGSSVQTGDKVTYTLQVKQAGEGAVAGASISDDLSKVLDDADYNGDVAATSGTVKVEGTDLLWTGDLAKGEVVDVTYSVTIKTGGDTSLVNTVKPGQPGEPEDPRGVCVPAADQNADCATEHRVGSFTYSKTSDPANGAAVKADQTVTYTLTIKQQGSGPVKGASVVDDLSDVLDDASWNNDAKASSGSIARDQNTLSWTGDLVEGGVVSITYSVKVKSSGSGTLVNTVTSNDSRGACVVDIGCSTKHSKEKKSLASTGANGILPGILLGGMLLLGGTALLISRRRRES